MRHRQVNHRTALRASSARFLFVAAGWISILLGSAFVSGSVSAGDLLEEASRAMEGRACRASSGLYDPESNVDAWHVGPGETRVLVDLAGPGEIRHMWFTLASADRRHPRAVVLRITWDGAEAPSVEVPFGDFFAAGHGMRAELNSLPVQVTSYGRALNCYWRMPFRRSARIEVTNEGTSDLCLYWQFDWMSLPRAPEGMLYFHARYRQEFPPRPFSPYLIFEGKGRGQYVGTVLSIQSSFGSWFGEADDRFWIDGEENPSIVGTGTEDYFNDAWNLRLFSNANTGVTIKEPNGEDSRFTGYRWHLAAPVTFRSSLRVDIERRSFCQVVDPATGERKDIDFKYRPDLCSSVAFWYQDAPAESAGPFPTVEERVAREIFVEPADRVDSVRVSPGVTASRRSNRVCHQKRMFRVQNDRVGGWFEVPFEVRDPGKYSVSVFQLLHSDEGIWKLTLSGPEGERVLDRALDFYDPYLAMKENRPENFVYGTWMERKLGIHALEPGDHSLRFECVGANPLSRAKGSDAPGLACGIDGISLRRFPWDDLQGWMARYLVEEEALFRSRIVEARRTVDSLSAKLNASRQDSGAWPPTLQVPQDPWGQRYRYEVPGRFNPDGFDLYSVHGNSRDPSGWIGNWSAPYRLPGGIEGEDLAPRDASSGTNPMAQELSIRDIPPLSGGKLLFIRMKGPGDRVSLPLSVPSPGTYAVNVRLLSSRDYGTVSFLLDGKAVGEPVNGFSPGIGTRWVDCGRVVVGADRASNGGPILTLEVEGKDPRSTGFHAGIDVVRLRRIE